MKSSNNIFLYDGTFVNLLCLIEYLIDERIKPIDICNENTYEYNLIDNIINLNLKNKIKLHEYINKNYKNIYKTIYYVFLSNNEKKEIIIFYFIVNFLKYKNNIYNYRYLNCVNKALNLSLRVSRETHKFKGFTRFKLINGKILFAVICPDNNILPLLSNHFSKRLKNDFWLIYDEKRQSYCLYNKKHCYFGNVTINFNKFEDTNIMWENLWKTFFKNIAIKERKNLKCQMNFMPKKYWKNIIEMEDL